VFVKLGHLLATAVLSAAVALSFAQVGSAQEGGPPPSAGTKIAEGLLSTTGATIGPDGALYVAEAGTGGDIMVTPPPDASPDEPPPTFGLTGRVSRIDPETGERTTAGSGLPSLGGPEGAGGAADVAFMGNAMYVLVTGGANYLGQEDWPNGIYRVNGDNVDLIADISQFNDDNPVTFPDAAPGGNPLAMDVRGNEFFVTDGNYNRILRVQTNGDISIVHSFDNVVPTGIEAGTSGPLLITQFGPFPETPENSFVISVALPSGTATQVATGFTSMIDVENGPGGTYVLQFGTTESDPEGDPFSGKILRLQGNTLTPLVTGFMLPTSLDFSGDTAYVTTLLGEVWQIENFSSVTPPPAPTPVPTTAPVPTPTRAGVTAPDTGTGPGDTTKTSWLALLAVVIACTGTASLGMAFARKRK
jgi:hypothetical protein